MNIAIFLSFRSFKRFGINTFNAIVINYFVCVITGLLFFYQDFILHLNMLQKSWIWIPIVLGLIFLGTFYLIAKTTQLFSVAIASISAKMSMVIPVFFSLVVLKLEIREFDLINFLGLALSVIAIILCSLKKDTGKFIPRTIFLVTLPFLVFVLSGVIDSSLNYINAQFLNQEQQKILPVYIFSSAFISGLIVLISQKKRPSLKDVFGGIYLGIPNYFSIYFLLMALSQFNNNGAVVFPVLNVSIIVTSSIFALMLFRERLDRRNIVGISLAVLAIILISYQDIMIFAN